MSYFLFLVPEPTVRPINQHAAVRHDLFLRPRQHNAAESRSMRKSLIGRLGRLLAQQRTIGTPLAFSPFASSVSWHEGSDSLGE
jgi:hypothetical protein